MESPISEGVAMVECKKDAVYLLGFTRWYLNPGPVATIHHHMDMFQSHGCLSLHSKWKFLACTWVPYSWPIPTSFQTFQVNTIRTMRRRVGGCLWMRLAMAQHEAWGALGTLGNACEQPWLEPHNNCTYGCARLLQFFCMLLLFLYFVYIRAMGPQAERLWRRLLYQAGTTAWWSAIGGAWRKLLPAQGGRAVFGGYWYTSLPTRWGFINGWNTASAVPSFQTHRQRANCGHVVCATRILKGLQPFVARIS